MRASSSSVDQRTRLRRPVERSVASELMAASSSFETYMRKRDMMSVYALVISSKTASSFLPWYEQQHDDLLGDSPSLLLQHVAVLMIQAARVSEIRPKRRNAQAPFSHHLLETTGNTLALLEYDIVLNNLHTRRWSIRRPDPVLDFR